MLDPLKIKEARVKYADVIDRVQREVNRLGGEISFEEIVAVTLIIIKDDESVPT